MAIISKLRGKTKKVEKKVALEDSKDLKKLALFFTIVNSGHGESVLKIFKQLGVSAQFVQKGEGTANQQVKDLLGLEDNRKDIVISIIREDKVKDAKKELEVYFLSSEKNRGIGFSIHMDTMVGKKIYSFLADTL